MEGRSEKVQHAQDVGRAVNYLLQRPDIVSDQLIYAGWSWGAYLGPMMTAVDGRFKACILICGGAGREKDGTAAPRNYAPFVRCPVLMLNGENDNMFPLATSAKPLFQAIASQDKQHHIFNTGHSLPWAEAFSIVDDWLDQRLGPVALDSKGLTPLEQVRRLIQFRRFIEAEPMLSELLSKPEGSPRLNDSELLDLRAMQALVWKTLGRKIEALQTYATLLEAQEARLGRQHGDTKRTAKDYGDLCQEVAWDLTAAPDRDPGDYAKAVELARRAAELKPTGDDRAWLLGWCQYRSKEYPACLATLAQLKSDTAEKWLISSLVHGKSGEMRLAQDLTLAADEFMYAMNVKEQRVQHVQREARLATTANPAEPCNSWERYVQTYTRLIERCPQDSLLWYRRGLVHARLANWRPAGCLSQKPVARDTSRKTTDYGTGGQADVWGAG